LIILIISLLTLHHLSFLIDAELVITNKQGKYIYYEINTSILEEILEWIYTLVDKEDKENG
jgi:DNA-binding transcriptional ArsR family regulator